MSESYRTVTRHRDLIVGELNPFPDSRGEFVTAFRIDWMSELVGKQIEPIAQVNRPRTYRKGLRGIHQGVSGEYKFLIPECPILGVWVNLNPGDDFGFVCSELLNEGQFVYVPPGWGNSFVCLGVPEIKHPVTYLVPKLFLAEERRKEITPFDPDLAIDWEALTGGIPETELIVSEKDRTNPTLREAFPDDWSAMMSRRSRE